MKVLQAVLVVMTTLVLCYGSRLPRQTPTTDKVTRLPMTNICGVTDVPFTTKIIGGTPAELGEFPWMALLGFLTEGSTDVSFNCGGSLITDQYVVTAAHCVHPSSIGTETKLTTIRLGELNLDPAVNDQAQPIDIPVDKIVIHKEYNGTEKTNDIALVKLKTKVTFTKYIRPICLPSPEFNTNDFEGFFPTIAGWGRTESKGPGDSSLRKAEVEIQNRDSCRLNVTSVSILAAAVIDHRVICAASLGKDSCQGDSGGPLMMPRKPKKSNKINFFLMGIVSYGYGCAKEGYPGIYTRVSRFMPWIMEYLDI